MVFLYLLFWKLIGRFYLFSERVIHQIAQIAIERDKLKSRRQNSKKTVLEFPGGIIDWWAFSSLVFVTLLPLLIGVIYINVKIVDQFYKFAIAFVAGVLFLAYIVYYKKRAVITSKIEEFIDSLPND